MASDVYEVWTCRMTGGPHQLSQVTPKNLVRDLAPHLGDYWQIQSGGAYQVSLVVGGTVWNPTGGCRSAVREGSDGVSNGALIIEMDSFSSSPTEADLLRRPCNAVRSHRRCADTYPDNERDILAPYESTRMGFTRVLCSPIGADIVSLGLCLPRSLPVCGWVLCQEVSGAFTQAHGQNGHNKWYRH